jgi:putative spermidine/putrescine transport system permease protein
MSTLRERSPVSYVLALPAALWMLGALVVPTLFIVWVSFWTTRTFSLASPLGLINYAKFFDRPAYVKLLIDTVLQTLLLMAITLVLGYSIGYFIVAKVRRPGLQLGLFLVLVIPFWTSALIRTIAWIPFLGVTGVINQALLFLGVVDQPIGVFLYSRTGITLAQVSFYTLLATGPVVYMLRNISPSLPQAAYSLKASPLQVFWRIILPLTLPGVLIGQLLVFLNVMADFATAAAIGGNKYAFLGNLVILLYDSGQLPFASVIAVLLMLCMLAGVAALLKVVDIRRLGTL